MAARRPNPIGAYVLHRIRKEFFDESGEPIRGKQAEIVKATGFKSATVSLIFARAKEGGTVVGRGVGRDFANAMADRVWHVSHAQMEEEALALAGGKRATLRPISERAAPWWRNDPTWASAAAMAKAEAKRRGLRIPTGEAKGETDYFALTGDAVVPGRAPTVEAIIRLAELLWMTDR